MCVRIYRIVILMLVVVIASLTTGCASFCGNQLPTVTPKELSVSDKLKPIDYDTNFHIQGKPTGAGVQAFQKIVEKTLKETEVFESVNPGTGREKTHLSITLNNHGNIGAAAFSGALCGATLFIIPGYARDKYTLTVEALDENALIKKYEYNDYMSTWIGWLFLPAMPWHMTPKVSEKVIGNMIQNSLKDIINDGILKKDAKIPDKPESGLPAAADK